jgi:hypothetical protein
VRFDEASTSAFVRVRAANYEGVASVPASGQMFVDVDPALSLVHVADVQAQVPARNATPLYLAVPTAPYGDLVVTLAGLALNQTPSGEFLGPAPTGAQGAWALGPVPIGASGSASYNAFLGQCQALTNASAPCGLASNLASGGTLQSQITNAHAEYQQGILHVQGQLTVTLPMPPVSLATESIFIVLSFSGTAASCAADFDGSGIRDADDLFAFLDAWFAQSGTVGPGLSADFNAGGFVDADDLFAFLDAWFAGCD